MKRKIYTDLLNWKKQKRGRTALLIEGARRIGKSYIVEEFARREYDSYLLIDFSVAPDLVKRFFDLYLTDLDVLFSKLLLFYQKKLQPRKSPGEEASALVIFDEVQFCPRARAAIKHLVADGRYDYIETGSLISIKKNVKDILLPSEEQAIEMFPMDFEEFVWALGDDMTVPFMREQFLKREPLGDIFHLRAMDYFRQYLIVGGMPQAVLTFVRENNYESVDEEKRRILKLYRDDIAHYADNQEIKVASIFDQIPEQLQKHEKRFVLTDLNPNARMREYESAFFWLSDAKIVNCCFNTTAPNIGLRLNLNRSSVKCYMADTGLLISLAFDEKKLPGEDLYRKLLFGSLSVNEGMLIENIVAQMLRAAGHRLYFYSANPKGAAADKMEIDFLIRKPSVTSRHNISPIEVKSGKYYQLTSLKKCIAKFADNLAEPFVLHDKDLKVQDGITFLPLYMSMFL